MTDQSSEGHQHLWEERADAWEVIYEGHILKAQLPQYAGRELLVIDRAADAYGLAAAVRWVAQRYGDDAANQLTQHITDQTNESVDAISDTVLTIKAVEDGLKEPPR